MIPGKYISIIVAVIGAIALISAAWIQSHNTLSPQSNINQSVVGGIRDGSLIIAQNQMGGQIAHSIQNYGNIPRNVTEAGANELVSALRSYPGEAFKIVALLGDSETINLAEKLERSLNEAGWTSKGIDQSVFVPVPKGIILVVPSGKENVRSINILGNWLYKNYLNVKGEEDKNQSAEYITIIIGYNDVSVTRVS